MHVFDYQMIFQRTESAKLEYNRQKASIQRVRRQDLVEGFAKLRAAIGATEQEYVRIQRFERMKEQKNCPIVFNDFFIVSIENQQQIY